MVLLRSLVTFHILASMKFRLFLIFFTLITCHAFSNDFWRKNYSAIDSIAKTVKPTKDLEKLVDRLTSHCRNDEEKYRSIFTWIAHTIAYDVEALKNPELRVTDAREVIKKKKAVCAGYSAVFIELCRLAGLECKAITGWARTSGQIGRPLGKTDHAWNAIRIGGEWYLCDVTWGAGHTDESRSVFTFEFRDFYFCTPPDLFSYNHFPDDDQWFLGEKISKARFVDRPHFYSNAIGINLKELSPEEGVLKYKNGQKVNISFETDVPPERILVHYSSEKHSRNVQFSSSGGRIEFQLEMDKYSPNINIFFNGKAILMYKVVR